MPIIIVENKSGLVWLTSDVEIFLDGKNCGKLNNDSKAEFTVAPGIHAIQVKVGKIYSSPIDFRAGERETVAFMCSAPGIWQKQVLLKQVFHGHPHDRFGTFKVSALDEQHEIPTLAKGEVKDWNIISNAGGEHSREEIRRAYLKLIRKYHPDKLINLRGEERAAAEVAARMINIAYLAAKKKRHTS